MLVNPVTERLQARLTGLGLINETHDRANLSGVNILTTGQAQRMSIGLKAGDVITNVICLVTTAGAAQTLVKVGLWSKAQALLGVSADVKANFTTTGFKVSALTAAYAVPTTDMYYVGILGVGGTQPTLLRESNLSSALVGLPSNLRSADQQGSLSDISGSFTPADTGMAYWFGVS